MGQFTCRHTQSSGVLEASHCWGVYLTGDGDGSGSSLSFHLLWPAHLMALRPSYPQFYHFLRLLQRERERESERERERERERGGGGGGGVYVSSGSSSKVKTYSCNDVSILSMDLCQSSKLLAADEGLHQLHNT